MDDVRLRAVAERDLLILELLDTQPELSEPFEWRGFRDAGRVRRRWERDRYLGDDDATLVVAIGDGELAGIVQWSRVATSGPAGCVQLGILLLPEHRGRGIGTVAHILVADHIFSTTTAHRIEATTEVDNVAEQRALERAGFTREGLLRGRGFVRGEWRDGLIYSRLRDDPAPAPPG